MPRPDTYQVPFLMQARLRMMVKTEFILDPRSEYKTQKSPGTPGLFAYGLRFMAYSLCDVMISVFT